MTIGQREWQMQRSEERLAKLRERGIEPGSEHLVRAWLFGSTRDGIEDRLTARGWEICFRAFNEAGFTGMPGETCFHARKRQRISDTDIAAMVDELLEIAGAEGELSGWGLEEHWQTMLRTGEPMR